MGTTLGLKPAKRSAAGSKKYDPGILEGLNESQRHAVVFQDGPLLIVAGAGTGKTTVITRRIAYLISQGIKPDQILALTFTDKAASEMEERVDVLLPYGYHDLWISTFHSFCERILKLHGLDIGIPGDFKVMDTTQQKILVRKNLEKFDLDYYRPLGNPTKFIGELVKHFSRAKDEEIYPEEYLKYAEKLKLDSDNPDFVSKDSESADDSEEIKRVNEVAGAYHIYQKLLLQNNALDFGDLINYALKLFRTRRKILDIYRKKFKFILVDEFQDTNFAQYELVKILAAPQNNINVVGDDDQSIYKFRGASISNILQFRKDYPHSKEITLTENYRSSQNILEMAYGFIQANNPERLEPRLGISKRLKSTTDSAGIIELICGQTLVDEVDKVVARILALKKEKNLTWNDFAILVRANDQADAFIAKVNQLGIPYTYFANRGLYKKSIILDLIYYLRVLINHHESSFLYRILNMDLFRIEQSELSSILFYAQKKTLSLYEALLAAVVPGAMPGLKKESIAKIEKLLNLVNKHSKDAAEKNIVEIFITAVADLKINKRIEEDTIENLENRELLEQFYRKIEQFEAENADKSTKNFLDVLDFELEAGEEGKINFDPNKGPESIKIMTVHSAKGLEFLYVFVVNMVQMRFPSVDRKEPIELPTPLVKDILQEGDIHLQEERRLFYVAMTRAKQGLFFSYGLDYGGAKTRKPSRFLVDVGLAAKPEKSVEISRKEQSIKKNYDKNLFLPNTFSYTHISDFRRCPLEYKYKYWLRLPVKGSGALSFGNTIHASLEKFLSLYKNRLEMTQLQLFGSGSDNSKLPSFKELIDIYEKNWIDEWYPDKANRESYYKNGKEILKNFYEGFSKNPPVSKYLEQRFQIKIGEYFLVGRIDRADFKDGVLHIIDYKTGNAKLENRGDGYEQLYIYQLAAQEFLNEKVGSLQYWYLQKNTESEPIVGTEKDIEDLKISLLDTIEEIRSTIAHNSFLERHQKLKDHACRFLELE